MKKFWDPSLSAGDVFLGGDDALRIKNQRFLLASPVLGEDIFLKSYSVFNEFQHFICLFMAKYCSSGAD